ncbi:putative transmembrane protein [uncultured Pleomorphomonas sp.]|uniref:Putative transmembrane protein n=1 Tax=uncultured Pleomorphomonas sp. TaxID=442121 RepID=A0A212L6W7_9HYPH|nr:hypothetical protein [uncultured Pleomorphomonas sp.]SCM73324.1 putative transmembrane protein [uncultured Pleomorphomonas sp.]
MTIHLVADWRRVLSRAWSMRLVYLAVAVLVLAEIAQWAVEIAYLPPIWSLLLRLAGVALMIAAIPARVLLQKEFHDE